MATTTQTGFNTQTKRRSGEEPRTAAREQGGLQQPLHQIMEAARKYARENPEAAALWCFGIGFVLGWKLKPW